MAEEYRTINRIYTAQIVEKKSRFIAALAPTPDREASESFIASVKKEHYNARHNCTAAVLDPDMTVLKYSDDGEPQGTAGRPMLEVLKGNGLCFVTAVVTRYFGGILLGTGGLSRAYSGALKEAVETAEIIRMVLGITWEITADYTLSGRLTNLFENLNINITDVRYTDRVTWLVSFTPSLAGSFRAALTEATGGSVIIAEKGEGYAPDMGKEV